MSMNAAALAATGPMNTGTGGRHADMIDQKCIEAGRRVLREEAQALLDLQDAIDESFARACRIILECRGKLVLTGVGKSGHIASKIASTLASTGTAAFFLQAGEAAHGDLGMVGPEDAVLAVSNSGEGGELKIMIPMLHRMRVPLIAITGNTASSLAAAADVTLSAHVSREACPLNLAPTTSTTAELAIGDALAVALIEARGFTAADFARYHPGGALGRRLLVRCGDVMHRDEDLPAVSASATITQSLLEMTQKGLGMVCITADDGRLCGIFTDGDLRRALERHLALETPVSAVMSRSPVVTSADTLAVDALSIMQDRKITSLIVTDTGGRPCGAFNIHDLLRAGIIV